MKALIVALGGLAFLAGVAMFVLGYIGIFTHNRTFVDAAFLTLFAFFLLGGATALVSTEWDQ